ncbi:MAG: FAD-dependent oxidoreductase, partial [Actinomycetota bacterium]|nr:FAD-dependent oxidoreductase [Actinomycetota bacterium]
MNGRDSDVVVVGGGIVGLAVARELLAREPGRSLTVLEREDALATQQTGRSSGVIHAGVYYEPGSLKARLCVEGARLLYEFCETRGIEARRAGKLIVASVESELGALDRLESRATANGVPGLRRLAANEIADVEPHAHGIAALHSPATGVVDFRVVAAALAAEVRAAGGTIETGREVTRIEAGGSGIALSGPRAATPLRAGFVVACAGAG